jgi:hypothetical protein
MSIMIIIDDFGVKDVLIIGKDEGEEQQVIENYNKISSEIKLFRDSINRKLQG